VKSRVSVFWERKGKVIVLLQRGKKDRYRETNYRGEKRGSVLPVMKKNDLGGGGKPAAFSLLKKKLVGRGGPGKRGGGDSFIHYHKKERKKEVKGVGVSLLINYILPGRGKGGKKIHNLLYFTR